MAVPVGIGSTKESRSPRRIPHALKMARGSVIGWGACTNLTVAQSDISDCRLFATYSELDGKELQKVLKMAPGNRKIHQETFGEAGIRERVTGIRRRESLGDSP